MDGRLALRRECHRAPLKKKGFYSAQCEIKSFPSGPAMASQPAQEAQLSDLLGVKHLSPSSDVVFIPHRNSPPVASSPISPQRSDSGLSNRSPAFLPFPHSSETFSQTHENKPGPNARFKNNGNNSPASFFSSWNPVMDASSHSSENNTENDFPSQYDEAWVDNWFGGMEINEPKPEPPTPTNHLVLKRPSDPRRSPDHYLYSKSSPEILKKEKKPGESLIASWSGVEFKPSSPSASFPSMDQSAPTSYPPYEDRARTRTRIPDPRYHPSSLQPRIPNSSHKAPTRQRAISDQFPGTPSQGRQRSATADAVPDLGSFRVNKSQPGYGYSRSHDSNQSHPGFVAYEEKMNRRHDLSASPRLQPGQQFFGGASPSPFPSQRHRSLSPGGEQPKYRRKSKGKNHGTFHGNRKDPESARFELDVAKVVSGEEQRTTLMVKNIPNKYSQEMLLEAVDEHHKGLYDFFYLPIDFKNKCNVGYAFINFIEPRSIPSFHTAFNQKKWLKFNSSKVCKITYARIQGKLAFIEHFRNSSLMHEDPKCRPLIFYSSGPQLGLAEPFPIPLPQFQRKADVDYNFDFDEDTSDPSP